MLKANLIELAKLHPTRKFMMIQATKCVENFEDVDVPCLLFYKGGELISQIAGSECRKAMGGLHTNMDCVEYVLVKEKGFLEKTFQDDPRDSLKTFNAFIHKKKAFMGADED
jgi:hypothetical protein